MIKEELNYCLHCRNKPCSLKGCPLGNDIPNIIQKMKENKYLEAYKILLNTTVLSGVCGEVCPHEKQCQGSCIRGIRGNPVEIGKIETELFNWAKDNNVKISKCWEDEIKDNINRNPNNTNIKIAIVGGGPAGLTAAAFLRKEGFKVTVYEKHNYLGGLMEHGIPDFRLNKEALKYTIENILELGIDVKYNMELGRNLKISNLEKEYDKIIIAIGANQSSKMGIEGEDLIGVYGGNELLEYKKFPNFKDKTVAIIGGGNVAMDCARTVKRLGANNVKVIYRRSRDEMPAEKKEIEDAIEENIEFLFKHNINKIIGNNKVEKLELIKTELVKKEGDSRLSPINIEGSNYQIDMDYIIMSLGGKNCEHIENLKIELDKWNNISVNNKYMTSNSKIYAIGDTIGKNKTVAWASFYGREVAKNILNEIEEKS